jgi:hypothetical protein
MKKDIEALAHLVVTIALLTLGTTLIKDPSAYNTETSNVILVFSIAYIVYCKLDTIVPYIKKLKGYDKTTHL